MEKDNFNVNNKNIENKDVQDEDVTDIKDKNENIKEDEDTKEKDIKDTKEKEENVKDENIINDEENEEKSKDEIFEELKSSNKNLADENNKLQNELDTMKDRLSRLGAEYDNFRKRTAKEKDEIYNNACEDILTKMLPVMDNLERAVSVEGDVDDIKKGIEMIMKQFKDSLESLQVEEISTEGKFDPNFHDAVMHVEDDKYGKDEIVEVFLKGYKREDRVLRYSMVKVAN